VHSILAERSTVTPDMAARLGRVFNTSSQLWLGMQAAHDVWGPEREPRIRRIRPFKRAGGLHSGPMRERKFGNVGSSGRNRRGAKP
jgi:plasmid maintenance system antidote protein VapI